MQQKISDKKTFQLPKTLRSKSLSSRRAATTPLFTQYWLSEKIDKETQISSDYWDRGQNQNHEAKVKAEARSMRPRPRPWRWLFRVY